MKLTRSHWIGIALLVVALAGAWVDPPMFFAAWLAAWWWCLGIVLGAFVNAWMHRLSGGDWGQAIGPVALALGRRLPWLLLLGLPILAGVRVLYPWAADSHALETIARPRFVQAWLDPPFFVVRVIVYALVWWWLTRTRSLHSGGRAAASLIVATVVTSLAAIDLLMSLMPRWFSDGFGLVVVANQALAGAAFAVAWPARVSIPPSERSIGQPPLSRDLGNLLLMWVMSWGYLAFMQFLIIWAEDLPREIAWFVPRLQTGWVGIGLGLVLGQFALPQVALLWRTNKDAPHRLARLAAWQLAWQLVNSAWLVLPAVAPHSAHGWWLVPLLALAIGLPLFGRLVRAIDRPARAGAAPEVSHA